MKRMAEVSGIDFDHAQAALARVFLGPDALQEELEKNQKVQFTLGTGQSIPCEIFQRRKLIIVSMT
jgi:hypothetical protein